VGTHRRISAAPSGADAAAADVATRIFRAASLTVGCHARRRGWVGLDSNIDRPVDPSPRAVKGPRRQAPLRRFGLQGVAVGPLRPRRQFSVERAVADSSPSGRKGQRASRVLYIGNSHDVAELGLACPSLTPLSRQVAWRTAEGATLGQGGIPMSQIAPAVGTAPARRLRRAAGGCGSIRRLPAAVGWRRDRSHHPATAATGRSRSAPRPSNHSDMAAH
jgi:hypothetical protein